MILRMIKELWYKLMALIFPPKFVQLDDYQQRYLHTLGRPPYSLRVLKSYSGISLHEEKLTREMSDANNDHGGELQVYLEEKLSPSQIRWVDHAVNGGAAVYEVGQSGCLQVELRNVRNKYWKAVVLSGLVYLLKRWDCQMYYAEVPLTPRGGLTDDSVLRRITLNIWMYRSPYRVHKQIWKGKGKVDVS